MAATGRQYGKLHMWRHQDERWRALTTDAQWLYAHTLSQPHINTAGIVPLQLNKWARGAADMNVERIQAALRDLLDHEFVLVDWDTEELLVCSFIADDIVPSGTPNLLTAAINRAHLVESGHLRAALAKEIGNLDRELTGDQQTRLEALRLGVSGA